MMENKLKHFTNSMLDNLLCPVQDRLEEWKKVANQLEKDHTKDYKKAMHEIKKRNTDSVRLQKKARKGSKTDVQQQLSSVMLDVNERFSTLMETEKSALRNLLVEERTRICLFANCLSPVLELQVSMLNEVTHLHDLTSDITRLCRNPKQLPTSTDQLVADFLSANSQSSTSPLADPQVTNNEDFFLQTHSLSPPSSPTSTDSRKSSMCSLNSINSSDSRSSGSFNHTSSFRHHHYPSYHRRTNSTGNSTTGQGSPTSCKSAPVGGGVVARLSSVSSHDSGFVSSGNAAIPSGNEFAKPPIPPPADKISQNGADGVSPVIRSRPNSEQLSSDFMVSPRSQNKPFSWKDWSRPGPYDNVPPSHPVNDPRQNVLPSKPQAPPPLSPKPDYLVHRSSMVDVPRDHPAPPLRHRNSEPAGFSFMTPKDEPSLPPPPLIGQDNSCSTEDAFPPPPPSLLSDDVGTIPNPPVPQMHQPNSAGVNPGHVNYATMPPNPVLPPSDYGPQSEFSSMTLGRKNSSNSLQYSSSSGYSSQNTTPACSEDTIASHDNDYDGDDALPHHRGRHDYEKFSTLPRNYHHSNSHAHARNSQQRRPASTAGVPETTMINTQIHTPGTATIRRKPSSKFNSVRRNCAPKPVQTPTVPSNNISNLMSTFQPLNHNHNNNYVEGMAGVENFGPSSNANFGENQNSVARDLTLKFRAEDMQDGSPTPTMTPTAGDFYGSYNGDFHSGVAPLHKKTSQ
ncbi:unnamed protein product [Clavelina lepadiformis]|uniref:IMD domain-containing protein n=2 Tax=Clavelina lepadiformis TaxID=159417 RepID=A0ABP0EWU9_CLALP